MSEQTLPKLHIGLIGKPTAHSMSPMCYARIFSENSVDGSFSLFTLNNEELPDVREFVYTRKLDAFAVTMPYKERIMQYLDAVSEKAKQIGSVNLVTVHDGKLFGYNTDGMGFIRALAADSILLDDRSVVVFGAGGAARSLIYQIKNYTSDICLVNRNCIKAQKTAREFGIEYVETLDDIPRANMFINATPVGMLGVEGFKSFAFLERLQEHSCVVDLIYKPAQTQLLQHAVALSLCAKNGLDMLYQQAVVAFDIISKQF